MSQETLSPSAAATEAAAPGLPTDGTAAGSTAPSTFAADPDASPGDDLLGQVNRVTGLQAGGDISIFNNAYTIRETQRRTVVHRFSFDDGRAVTATEERHAEAYFAGVEAEADGLARHLEERRVLLLSAPPGARKVTAAIGAARRLQARGICNDPAFVFEPLNRRLRLDLCRLPEQHPRLRGRVVVFRYPLSRGNPDLAAALTATEPAGWARLAECLRERDACLVLTVTPDEARHLADAPALRRLHRELAPHPAPVLGRWLDDALRERGEGTGEPLRALAEVRQELVKRFDFGPHLREFVDFFAGLDPVVPFEEAHALFQDTCKRLMHEGGDDFDGWLFGFTLALAQCTPDASGVPWMDFDRLRRYLRRWLRRDLQLPGATLDAEEAEPGEVRLELSDDTLLTRSRTTVERNPATLAYEIRFRDGPPAESLWGDLLRRHRRVLTAILPRLRDLAERAEPDERTLGELAAQIIGRIGEIDPERVVVPLVERWAVRASGRHRGLVGALFDGVIASGDAPFRSRCLRHLQSMHREADGPAATGRVEAALAAYSWVGYHDFRLAMDELFSVSRAHLVPMIADAAAISRLVTRIQAELERTGGSGGESARSVRGVLRRLVDRVYQQRGGIFLGVQYALSSLCAAHGVAPVLRELREWIGRSGPSMGVLVAIMFLHEHGIADQLAEDAAELPPGDGLPAAGCSQFVRALGGGEGDVLQAARFLGDLHDSVTSPWATEAMVRRHCRERLQAQLAGWTREALGVPELVEPTRAFVEQLARTHGGSLREVVVQVFSTGEFARTPELALFAASLRC